MNDKFSDFYTHIDIAEEWVSKHYSSAEDFGKVEDLRSEAFKIFDQWGVGQNSGTDIDSMIDALSFVQTYRDIYFD